MNSAYWNDRYNYLMQNHPPKSDSYYNQSFVDRMNEAQKNIDNLVAEKDKAWSAANQKQDEYNTFAGTVSSYNEVYTQASSEFGVPEHQENYEKSKKALALAESTLSALPSTINANSNRVLTQAQRELKYNVLADRYNAYQTNVAARTSAYEQVWKKARENQAEYAKAEIASQMGKLSDYNNAWATSMEQYLNAANKVNQATIDMLGTKEEYRNWQHQQYENANSVWMKQLDAALDRYREALNTELTEKASQTQINNMYTQAMLAPTTYDFGNGYSIRGATGGEGAYYYNGDQVSVYDFLKGTSRNGTNWDAWNRVWNSGVSTRGVGSDTVEAFKTIEGAWASI